MSSTDVAEEDDEVGLGGTLRNYATSIGTDILSLPTTALAIPQHLVSAGRALYNTYGTDKKFLEEFAVQNQIEGAQKNIQDHLATVRNTWRNEEPDISDKELNASLDNYMKSKEFEDFTTSQLSGAVWLDAKVKDVIRNIAGDERPASERSMGEDIAGIVATAGVGAPAGIPAKLAGMAGRTAMTAAIFNNPVSRTAIKAAELTTPLTIPYTPLNVAANAAVGVGLDQALRAAQDKPTLFSDPQESDSKLGMIAATGAGIAGVAGLAMAMRGHNSSVLRAAMERSDTAKAVAEHPSIDIRVPPETQTGEASIVAGPEQRVAPPAYSEELNLPTRLWRWTKDKLIDEAASPVSAVRDVADRDAANLVEQTYRTYSGAINSDRRRTYSAVYTHDFERAYNSVTPEERRAFDTGINAINYKAERESIEAYTKRHIEKLETALAKKGITPQAKSSITRDLAEAKDNLARFNDPANIAARHALPELDPREVVDVANRALADQSPVQLKLKDEFRKVVSKMHDELVNGQKLTRQESNELLAKAPYYIPPISDPLNGARGIDRVVKGLLYSSKQYFAHQSQGTAAAVARETPLGRMPVKVPNVEGPETRITAQLNPASALKMFVDRTLADSGMTYMRNTAMRAMAFKNGLDMPGMETDLLKNGHMQIVKNPRTDSAWHFGSERNSAWAQKMFEDSRVVPEWQAGHFRFWKLGDEEWARLFRQEPQLMHGLAVLPAAFSRLFKMFTTGYGNPGFAPVGAAYDLTVGLITTHHNRAFGPLSHIVRKYGPNWMSVPFKFMPDPTAVVGVVYHAIRGLIDVQVTTAVRGFADTLASLHPAISAMKQTMGDRMFYGAVEQSLRAANWSHELATNRMLREGLTHGYGANVDNIVKVRDHYNAMSDKVPSSLRAVWRFYKNVVDAVYVAPKRMFYTENYGILHKKYGGNIPGEEIEKLIYETRALGGDMTIRPSSIFVRDLEAAFPYVTQTKLGTYHLLRQMSSNETSWYVLPRLAFLTLAYAQGVYWRHYWNEESRVDLHERTPAYEKYRYIYVPTYELANSWLNGGNLPYDRSLYYKITIAPDFAGILAGTAGMLKALNLLPSSVAHDKPLVHEWMGATWDSLRPAMPPALQALLATSSMSLDPATAEQRGGNMVRSFTNPYRVGPAAESATPLGEVSMSTSLLLKAMFGTMGSHIAQGLDAGMHATKFDISTGGGITAKQAYDFNRGLSTATNVVFERMGERRPDVPPLWTGKERLVTMTPAWEAVGEATGYMRSIAGIRNSAMGKTSQLNRQLVAATGGVKGKILADLTLLKIADDIARFQNPTGEFGALKEQYNQLSNIDRGVVNNYKMPQAERKEKHNMYIKYMQDNLMQRHLSINFLEQAIEQKYGQYLAPILAGRGVTMRSLDALMRERLGQPSLQQPSAAAAGDEQ